MSDFFALSDGTEINAEDKSIELAGGGGDFLPIPAGTRVKAAIEEAKFSTSDELGTYIDLKWAVTAPEMYKGRKIFQKIKVFATKEPIPSRVNDEAEHKESLKKVQDKALRMFAVIDGNCGGKHLANRAKQPTDASLQQYLCGKLMALTLETWTIDKERNGDVTPLHDRKSGNWIKAVQPKTEYVEQDKADLEAAAARQLQRHTASLNAAGAMVPTKQVSGAGFKDDGFDEDIPF